MSPRDHTGTTLSWRHNGTTLEVELHHEPLNEIGTTTLDELELLADYVKVGAGDARAMLFYSSRKGFCAGADLRELYSGMRERKDALDARLSRVSRRLPMGAGLFERGAKRAGRALVRREIRRFLERIHRVFDIFDTAPLTTIAAVHGVVFGGGFELALTADIIVAERSARFCFPELRLGIIPGFGGIPRLKRDLGNAAVRDLLLTGRSLNASRASECGLVSQKVGRGQALDAARRVAEQAAKFDAYTATKAKRFLKPIPAAELAAERALFCELVTRPAVFEALQTFVESTDRQPYLPKGTP